MSEKIYRVQMNSKGMPNFATAEEVADRPQKEAVNGKCPICHKRLKGNKMFLCEECSEKVARAIWETHFSEPYASAKGADDE